MIRIEIIIIAIKKMTCKILTIPRSFVFLNISKSCPEILDKPTLAPEELNSNPRTVQINAIIKIITATLIISLYYNILNENT